ncbi:MAG: ferredoxin [Desulfamplus sp.]|nr:ferredoxin [Desulfamplus sp.]
MKQPVIDISQCVLCDICVDVCPEIFIKNDSGYIEVAEDAAERLYDTHGNPINPRLLEDVLEAVKNCRGDCISWDETTKTKSV